MRTLGSRLLCVLLFLLGHLAPVVTPANTATSQSTTTDQQDLSNSSSNITCNSTADPDNDPYTTLHRVTICQRDANQNLINCVTKVIGCAPPVVESSPSTQQDQTILVLELFPVCYSRNPDDGSLTNCSDTTLTTVKNADSSSGGVSGGGAEDEFSGIVCSARRPDGAMANCTSAFAIFGKSNGQQPVDTVLCLSKSSQDESLSNCTTAENSPDGVQAEATIVCYDRTDTNGPLSNCTPAIFSEIVTMESVTVCSSRDDTGSWTNCVEADITVSSDATKDPSVICSSRLADGSLADCTATNEDEGGQPLETIVCYSTDPDDGSLTDCTTPESKQMVDGVQAQAYLVCYARDDSTGSWTDCYTATFEESLSLDVVTVCYTRSAEGVLSDCTGEASVSVRSDNTDPGVVCASVAADGTLANCTASNVVGGDAAQQPIGTIVCYSQNADGTLADCTTSNSGNVGNDGGVTAEAYLVCYARDAATGDLTDCTKATYEGPPVVAEPDVVPAPVSTPAPAPAPVTTITALPVQGAGGGGSGSGNSVGSTVRGKGSSGSKKSKGKSGGAKKGPGGASLVARQEVSATRSSNGSFATVVAVFIWTAYHMTSTAFDPII